VLTVAGDEGGQLSYKVADTHTIVSYGKKAVGFTKLPVDFKSGDTVTLTAAVNGKVITVVELTRITMWFALVLVHLQQSKLD